MKSSAIAKYVLGGIVLILGLFVADRFIGIDEIQWRGQTFKFKKRFLNYEEYKDSNGQFADPELDKIKRQCCQSRFRNFSVQKMN